MFHSTRLWSQRVLLYVGVALVVIGIGTSACASVIKPAVQSAAVLKTTRMSTSVIPTCVDQAYIYSMGWREFPPNPHVSVYDRDTGYCETFDNVTEPDVWVDFASKDGAVVVMYHVDMPNKTELLSATLFYQADRPIPVATVDANGVKLVPYVVLYFALPNGASFDPSQAFNLTRHWPNAQAFAMSDLFGDRVYLQPQDVAYTYSAAKG